MDHVSRKGPTKGLQSEQSLTVYYYRKLNQEAINAVYTILPLIVSLLLHWPLCWLHPLCGGDTFSAITSELSCLLLITMLLLLMAFIMSLYFICQGFLCNDTEMKFTYGPSISPHAVSNMYRTLWIHSLYLMVSRKDITISTVKDLWSSPPSRVGVLMGAYHCRQNLSFAHLGHWAPSCGRGPCTGWKEPSPAWL